MLIRAPHVSDEEAIREADTLMRPWAFSLDLAPDEPFEAWLLRRQAEEAGDVPPGRVPAAFRVAYSGGVLLGRLSIRFSLNEWLAKYGGHVGYGVLPEHRHKGVATALLGHALPVLRDHDVEQALVVCDEDNLASARVAELLGGLLTNRMTDESGHPIRQYLVPTAPRGDHR